MLKSIILDRDGVINQDSPDYIKSAQEWVPIPGSIEAIVALSQAGYTVAVATNQAGLAKGKFDQADLDAMHAKMCDMVEAAGGKIDLIVYCPHHPDDACDCRKPKPGLLHAIESELGVSVAGVPFVGDKVSDIQCARAAGAKPILVKTGKGAAVAAEQGDQLAGVAIYDNLWNFVQGLL